MAVERKDSCLSSTSEGVLITDAAAPKTRDFAILEEKNMNHEHGGTETVPIKAAKEQSSVWKRIKVTAAFSKMGCRG